MAGAGTVLNTPSGSLRVCCERLTMRKIASDSPGLRGPGFNVNRGILMPVSLLPQLHLAGHQRLLVAYSGGLDSSVLLQQLVLLRRQLPDLQLRAIHVHHGLSPFADRWADSCRQQCLQWQVPLEVVKVQVNSRQMGVEAAARAARYDAFKQHIQPGECLVTAQHQNDQCETLLLALKRGSGPAGLAAMPQHASLAGHVHLRPLLSHTREQLETWAADHQLSWIEDESNQDQRYDRNFLRQAVLPLLTARWPHFSQAVSRSAALCGEQEQLLDELLAESLSHLVTADGALTFPPLAEMSDARRSALLRRWVAGQGGLMPSRDALQRLWQEVACSREDAAPRLVLGRFEVRRFRDRLYWLVLGNAVRDDVIDWPSPWEPLTLPDGLGQLLTGTEGLAVRTPEEGEKVTVRFQAPGQFHIPGRAGSRSLKKLWQEWDIPPWQRGRTPLIFYGEHFVAAAGVRVTREGEPLSDKVWKIHWKK